MFCSSLRKRPTWAHIAPVLLNDKAAKWRETSLDSHDIAFPVFRPGTPMYAFRITLLAAEDVGASNGRQRVASLAHTSGGKGAAVLFLVADDRSRGAGGAGPGAMDVFLKLQTEVATSSPMTLVPLASMSDLYPTLMLLRSRLNQPAVDVAAAESGFDSASGISTLLSSCILGRQLTNHELATLSRLPVTSVQTLAQKALTSEGQELLTKNFDDDLAQRVVGFFTNHTRVSSGLK